MSNCNEHSLEHASCLLTMDMMQSGLQSFVEQRPLSLDSRARMLLMGALYDLLWTLQDLLQFCSITFAFLTASERSFQCESSMTGPALSWTWQQHTSVDQTTQWSPYTSLCWDLISETQWRSTEITTIETLITVSFTKIVVRGWEWKQLDLQELRFAAQL